MFNLKDRGSLKEVDAYYRIYFAERATTGHRLKGMDFEATLLGMSPDAIRELMSTMAIGVGHFHLFESAMIHLLNSPDISQSH